MRRFGIESDLTQVFDIYMHPDVVPYLGYDPMPLEGFRPIFDEFLQSGSFQIIEQEGVVAGFLKITRYPGRASHVAYIGSFAIRPDLQGSGLAQPVIDEVLAELRSQGVKRVELIVESDNAKAIKFYQKLGFNIEGTLRKFYKRSHQAHYIDDHIMAVLFD